MSEVKKKSRFPVVRLLVYVVLGIGSFFLVKQVFYWQALSVERSKAGSEITLPGKPAGLVLDVMPGPNGE